MSAGCHPLHQLHASQALLRGVASGPRPSDYLPTAARSPSDPLRRLVIIDENVERIYGAQLRKVSGLGCTLGLTGLHVVVDGDAAYAAVVRANLHCGDCAPHQLFVHHMSSGCSCI